MLEALFPEPAPCAGPSALPCAANALSLTFGEEVPFRIDPAAISEGDLGLGFGLEPALDDRRRNARNALIRALASAVQDGCCAVFYSRDRNWYSGNRRHLPEWLSLRTIAWAVATMEAAPNFFRSERAAPSAPGHAPALRRRSRLAPGPHFLSVARTMPADCAPASGLVVLRDGRGRVVPCPDTPEVERSRRLLARYNAELARHVIEHVPEAGADTMSPRRRLLHVAVVRIFNRDISRGGRFYRGAWMSLSKADRARLEIDGVRTVEVDYAACHARLLLAAAGDAALARDPHFDPYGIPGLSRTVAKLAFLILSNASDQTEAAAALAHRLAEQGIAYADAAARHALAAVKAHHPTLEPLWATGIGLELMHIDSEMCLAVIEDLLDQNVVSLSVHDSFLVAVPHEPALRAAMDRAFDIGMAMAQRRFAARLEETGFCSSGLTIWPPPPPPCPSPSRPPFRELMRHRAIRLQGELHRLLEIDPRLLPGRVRLAVLLAGTLYPLANDIEYRAHAFLASVRALAPIDTDHARLITKIVSEAKQRGHYRISDLGAARLAAAPPGLAHELGLVLLRPRVPPAETRQRRSNLARKVRRQRRRRPPRVVDLARARPWELEGCARSVWYARHPDPIERQRLGLRALISRGDSTAVAAVRAEIEARDAAAGNPAPALESLRRLLALDQSPGAEIVDGPEVVS